MYLTLDFLYFFFFFFKQKTAYDMRISDWSSDVCSSDLRLRPRPVEGRQLQGRRLQSLDDDEGRRRLALPLLRVRRQDLRRDQGQDRDPRAADQGGRTGRADRRHGAEVEVLSVSFAPARRLRSEEHTSEIQSLMRTSYAVFCLKKKKK